MRNHKLFEWQGCGPAFLRSLLVPVDITGHRQRLSCNSGRRSIRLLVLLWSPRARGNGMQRSRSTTYLFSLSLAETPNSIRFRSCLDSVARFYCIWVLDRHHFGPVEIDLDCCPEQRKRGWTSCVWLPGVKFIPLNLIHYIAVEACLACCAACFIGLLQSAVEYFNRYAYIEIGMS